MLPCSLSHNENVFVLQPDELLSSRIQSLCPTISGDICCTLEQFETLRSQVQQVLPKIMFIKLPLARTFVSFFSLAGTGIIVYFFSVYDFV